MIILKRWYIAETSNQQLGSGRTRKLTGYLKGLGAELYYPLVPGDNGRKVQYSPGYLYLKADPDDPNWHLIKKGTGIKSILDRISDAEMEALMANVEHLNQNGYIQDGLESGASIVITNGQFKGLEGKVNGAPINGRVPVVLYAFGLQNHRQIDVGSISMRTT